MVRKLRWQLALALAGVLGVAVLLVVFSNRAFEDRPARGGALVEAVVGQPAVFNPLFAVDDSEQDIVRLLFSGLTRPGPDGTLRGDLAAGWSLTGDRRTYTFQLREGTTWHDGEPVTSDDVVFTARLARAVANDPRLSVVASPYVRAWARVTASRLDERTVSLVLDEPYAPFLDATTLGVLPEHLLADVPAQDLPNHRFSRLEPIGTGRYRIDLPGGVAGDFVRLKRFDRHWDAGDRRPYLDEVTFRFYPTVASAVAALGEHEVQAMGELPPDAVGVLGENARLYLAQQPGYSLVYLNTANVLFAEAEVRHALSVAVDRQGLVQDPDVVNGQGVVARSPIAPASWAFDTSLPAPVYDPAAAGALLEGRGWVDSDGDAVRDREGKALRFSLASRDDALSLAIAERLRDGWSAIGIDVTVQPMNQPATVATLVNRAFDAVLFRWDLRQYDPDPYPLWHSSQGSEGQNYGGFANVDTDRLLAEGRQVSPDDSAERSRLYRAFQQIFATEEPALLLYHPVYTYAVVDPALGGVQLPPMLVESADRFMSLPDWYVRTERVFFNR